MAQLADADRDGDGRTPPVADHRAFLVGLARAFAGALIFALPMLMTMEMWRIGFYMDPLRLILLLVLLVPLLIGMARFSGFKHTIGLLDEAVDAFVAIAVAMVMATAVLMLFGVITTEMPPREIIGKVALQTVAGSIGAMLARGQIHGGGDEDQESELREPGYGGEMLVMTAGALFLGLNVAPTEEMVLLSYMMDPWRTIGLALLSLVLMHAFVYAVEFPGGSSGGEEAFWSVFLRYTVAGYALVLVISLYLLWTFGRIDGTSLEAIIGTTVVLGFPGAIGAAAARLIL